MARRPTKADEIRSLLTDVFGPGDYEEIARRFSEWDMGSPRGVLLWLRQYQNEGKLPAHQVPPSGADMTADDETQQYRRARLLERIENVAEVQRFNALRLRDMITAARKHGCTWQEIAAKLGVSYPTVLRQYKAGSPIVVVRPYQKGWNGNGNRGNGPAGNGPGPGDSRD